MTVIRNVTTTFSGDLCQTPEQIVPEAAPNLNEMATLVTEINNPNRNNNESIVTVSKVIS